jgi:hypothetical protein
MAYKKGGIAVHVVEVTGDQYRCRTNVGRRMN